MMQETNTLIVGASISGLASAGCLGVAGIDYIIIEKHPAVVTPWRNHYERLHLHTNKKLSHLPYKKFRRDIPLYPSRLQVIEYMDCYQKEFGIDPIFNTAARSIYKEGDYWITETSTGNFRSKNLIMATGAYGLPRAIDFKGMDTFPGKILHSSDFKNGQAFKNQKVLVVGFGNSACEIALNLHEQGASPSLSVRSAVNVLPRDILGIPVLQLGLLMSVLPPRLADKLNAPIIRTITGDIRRLGLRKLPYGPLEQIQKDQTVPLLDIGTLKLIRSGNCIVYDEIDFIQNKTVFFKSGRKKDFDTIIAAIGYNKGFEQDLLRVDKCRFEDLNVKVENQKYFGKDGLYFCGFYVSPTGQIREIGLDAQKISKSITKNK
jgi:indole-3-pyruvate monooxygenase